MAANLKLFKKGETLFTEGQASQSMFLIQSGTVSVRKRKGTRQVEIAKVYSNEVIGELSFFDRKPRSASAVALSELKTLEIDFDALEKIYEKVPPYIKTIMACIAERLRTADELIRKYGREVRDEDDSQQSGEMGAGEVLETISKSREPNESPAESAGPEETSDSNEDDQN